MVSITVFSMMLVVLCIGTAVGAPTKRQSSDDNENGLGLNGAIIVLQNVASKLTNSAFSRSIADDVRFAVCILRGFNWSRGDINQSNFSALASVKEAVINKSCSWLSSISSPNKTYSCDEMCSTGDVMLKISSMLYETLVWYKRNSQSTGCCEWVNNNLGAGYSEEIRTFVQTRCLRKCK
ncbi:hypothetical protein EMCRGX_G017697 [Ephydatia muelleri]